MQANSWHHELFHFHLSFCIKKVWKGKEKYTKIWISRDWKELYRWNEKHFIVFKGLSFGEKIKKKKDKNSRHKLQDEILWKTI